MFIGTGGRRGSMYNPGTFWVQWKARARVAAVHNYDNVSFSVNGFR